MMVRGQAEFASGALVFPGGALEDGDRDPTLRERTPPGVQGLSDEDLALRIAAVREVYEECGVLLARPYGQPDVVGPARLEDIDTRHGTARAGHQIDISSLTESEDLELAVDLLVPFAHWITPAIRPIRFDTHFYLAPAPSDQVAVHDGTELVDSVWHTPSEFCAQADEGRWQLMFPTRMNLTKLARSARVVDAIKAARASDIVTVMPKGERVEKGRRLRIPPEAGYDLSEVVVDNLGRIVPES